MGARSPSSLTRALAIGMLLSCAAIPAHARKKGKARAKTAATVAVIVTQKGKPSRQLLKAITTALQPPARKMSGVKIISGKTLQRKLRRNPVAALKACGADLRCVSRLGRKVAAKAVIIARVSARDNGGATVGLVVVDVASMTVARQLSVELTNVADISERLVIAFAQALGDSDTPIADTTRAAATPSDAEDGEVEELALAALPLEPPQAEPEIPMLEPPPPRRRSRQADGGAGDESALEAMPASESPALAALPLEPMPEDLGSEATRRELDVRLDPPSPLLRYTGYGLVGLGVVGIVVGSIFGVQSTALPGSVRYGPGGTPQHAAPQIQADSDQATETANIMFATGAGAAVIGAVLAALDLFVFNRGPRPSSVVASLGIGGDPLGMNIGWSW